MMILCLKHLPPQSSSNTFLVNSFSFFGAHSFIQSILIEQCYMPDVILGAFRTAVNKVDESLAHVDLTLGEGWKEIDI